jgi:gluconolactonase
MQQKTEKITGGLGAAAGPVFSRRGYLLFSDVTANRILKWQRGDISVFRENSNGARANTFDHQGRLLTCEKGRVTRTEKDGKITVLGSGLKAPGDLVYAIDGSVYVADPEAGAVYQITRKGELRPVTRDAEHPAGVALAPNQQRLFVADAGRKQVRVYDVAADGALTGGKVFAGTPERPGGLKTDESGGVWVACAASGIQRFDAAGKALGAIAIPEPAGNCNWGEGFRDLYVTAGTSVYRVAARVNGTRTY